jgi:hypothetical protein
VVLSISRDRHVRFDPPLRQSALPIRDAPILFFFSDAEVSCYFVL